jgi:hypothetical protein
LPLLSERRSPQGFRAGSEVPSRGGVDAESHSRNQNTLRHVIIVCKYLFVLFGVTKELIERYLKQENFEADRIKKRGFIKKQQPDDRLSPGCCKKSGGRM